MVVRKAQCLLHLWEWFLADLYFLKSWRYNFVQELFSCLIKSCHQRFKFWIFCIVLSLQSGAKDMEEISWLTFLELSLIKRIFIQLIPTKATRQACWLANLQYTLVFENKLVCNLLLYILQVIIHVIKWLYSSFFLYCKAHVPL